MIRALAVLLLAAGPALSPAWSQTLDLTHGGPVEVTATGGIELRQNEHVVIASGDARAVRQGVTISADRLIAHYRPKAGATPAAATTPDPTDTGGSEIFRLEAQGRVRIFTPTDQAQGDRAIYDLDQAVMVLTGQNLKLTTPQQTLTARDSLEYWPNRRMAVARGNAVVTTTDARRIAADTLVAYTAEGRPEDAPKPAPAPAAAGGDDPLAASGKLEKVEAFGNVEVRTPTDTVRGERAVYVPDSGIARLAGNVRITRGQNQLNGNEADVNLKTGVSTLLAGQGGRVEGQVLPNDPTNKTPTNKTGPTPDAAAPKAGP